MKTFCGFLIMCTSINLFSQSGKTIVNNEWNLLDDSTYSISYPKTWTMDTSGENGTKFYLFSPFLSENDHFKENVNLLIQDMEGFQITLDEYAEFTIDDIKNNVLNSTIIESTRKNAHGYEFHKMVYNGEIRNNNITFFQYYYIKTNKVYLLTFTTETSQYSRYLPVCERIMDSFILK